MGNLEIFAYLFMGNLTPIFEEYLPLIWCNLSISCLPFSIPENNQHSLAYTIVQIFWTVILIIFILNRWSKKKQLGILNVTNLLNGDETDAVNLDGNGGIHPEIIQDMVEMVSYIPEIGHWVAVMWMSDWYPGIITEVTIFFHYFILQITNIKK